MIEVLTELVPLMKDGEIPLKFFYGDKGWLNMFADKKGGLPAVYYFWPLDEDWQLQKGGRIDEEHPMEILIIKKSELKWSPEEHRINCVLPCKQWARELITLLQHSKLVDWVDSNASVKEFILTRELDVGVSGVKLLLKAKPRITTSVCPVV